MSAMTGPSTAASPRRSSSTSLATAAANIRRSTCTEDEFAAEKVAKTTSVAGFERRRPARKPFPDHLPRERVVIAAPTACFCCGSDRIVKMGEHITETLEVIPRQWKVIQTVCEKSPVGPARRSVSRRHLSSPRRADVPRLARDDEHELVLHSGAQQRLLGVSVSGAAIARRAGTRLVAHILPERLAGRRDERFGPRATRQ